MPQPPTPPLYQNSPTLYQNTPAIPTQQPGHNNHNVPFPRISFTKYSKVEFPKFDGEDLRTWLYKAGQFFADEEVTIQHRMKLVSLHFDGDALQWHLGYMRIRGQLPLSSWEEYIWALCDSFGAENSDPMTEIMSIKHTGSVKDYQKAFVGVTTRLDISVEHVISIFLHNLKPELSHAVKVGNPCTLPQAYYLIRLHEASFVAQSKAIKIASIGSSWNRGQGSGNLQRNNNIVPKRPTTAKFDNTKRRRRTPVEMEEKGAQGLCFFCDEKYVAGHKCQAKRQLFSLELEEGAVLEEEEEQGEETLVEEEGEVVEPIENCAISLQALNGTMGYQTLRLRIFTEQQPIEIFIDCGSTHNFKHEDAARRLGCKISKIKPQLVQVADGRELPTDNICKGLQWLMQGAVFQDDFLVFPIGKSDVVLGIRWLCPLDDIKFNFKKLLMEFEHQGKILTLRGIQPKFKIVKAKSIEKIMIRGSQLFMVKVKEAETEIQELEEDQGEEQALEIRILLDKYADVFGEPTQLPPSRGVFDHHIPLWKAPHQLTQDPTGKKDDSWRLCMDYRALNKEIVKDKFPIQIIEELLDELGGSQVYSKINLRAGYHQIRMEATDVPKTAFKTHSGHYEYLVMPFGLTNAPSSFQGLMNHIFQDHLRKFILVPFYDILVYSRSLEEHIQYLKVAFELLVQHQLLAKKSKYVIAAKRVEYLGHYISAQGVATDPRKVEAMRTWPEPQIVTQLRGFLGLAGYYRRFIRSYGIISKPLTDMLKKDHIMWSEDAIDASRRHLLLH